MSTKLQWMEYMIECPHLLYNLIILIARNPFGDFLFNSILDVLNFIFLGVVLFGSSTDCLVLQPRIKQTFFFITQFIASLLIIPSLDCLLTLNSLMLAAQFKYL